MKTAIFLLMAAICCAQEHTGSVRGIMTGQLGAGKVGMRVVVSSPTAKCETTTVAKGEFACALPAGRYFITSNAEGFYPYRRASILVEAGLPTIVNLVMSGNLGLEIQSVYPPTEQEFEARRPRPLEYEEQTIGARDVLVRYRSVRRASGQIAFSGELLMLSLDTLAIYADQMVCSDPIRSCSASGHVVVELGKERLEGTKLDVDLVGRKFSLTGDMQAIRAF